MLAGGPGQIEVWLTFFFLVDYVLYLYAAESKLKHVTKTMHVIDFITILPGVSYNRDLYWYTIL